MMCNDALFHVRKVSFGIVSAFLAYWMNTRFGNKHFCLQVTRILHI